MRGLPSNIEDSGSHVILLKSVTDAGKIEIAIKHIEWIKFNSPFKLQLVLTELFASLSTSPNLEPVVQLLWIIHVQGLVSNADPRMEILEGCYYHLWSRITSYSRLKWLICLFSIINLWLSSQVTCFQLIPMFEFN